MKTRFVVIGDTHFCFRKHHPDLSRTSELGNLPDYIRYVGMTETTGRKILSMIRELKPDLLISTGDYVEGGLEANPSFAEEELLDGWNMLKSIGCPVLIAKGTHEGKAGSPGGNFYRKNIIPAMAENLGASFSKEYFSYEFNGSVFIILDYLNYEGEQEKWLVNELERVSVKAEHIYIFAHPPLYLWGRHFFDNPEFSKSLDAICRKYPVDIYFCGHTHNQSISFHEKADRKGFLQLKGSSVGYANMPLCSMDSYHAVADFGRSNKFYWGVLEDSAPGFFLVESDGEKTEISWKSLSGEASMQLRSHFAEPENIRIPSFPPLNRRLDEDDLHQIISARLNLFSVNKGINNSVLKLNGFELGPMPDNVSYAARRFINLPEELLRSLRKANELEIKMTEANLFAVGSISLELLLYDGRRIISRVNPELFYCGKAWETYRNPERFTKVNSGATLTVSLCFD